MQKDDEYYTNIHIPSVFLAYSDGETLLYAMRKALPWNPVLVTLNEHGERMISFWSLLFRYIDP